jgi:hypothetical protein
MIEMSDDLKVLLFCFAMVGFSIWIKLPYFASLTTVGVS